MTIADHVSAALDAFKDAVRRLSEDPSAEEALDGLVAGLATAANADEAVVRIVDRDTESLVARYVWARAPSLAAELIGSQAPLDELGSGAFEDAQGRHVLRRLVVRRGERVGTLELVRSETPFESSDEVLAELGAIQIGFVLGAGVHGGTVDGGIPRGWALELAGDGLAAGSEDVDRTDRVVRLAAEATGARCSAVWRNADDGALEMVASHRCPEDLAPKLREAAARALEGAGPVAIEREPEGLGEIVLATVRLGEPPLGALQLLFDPDAAPHPEELARLGGFGVRAANALRAGDAATHAAAELERTRTLVAVLGQAVARLSLVHTLETAVDRIADLLEIDRIALYLREGSGLRSVAARGLTGLHERVAEALLEVALGPYRGRESLLVEEVGREPTLMRVRAAAKEAGIEAALAVPLLAHEQVIGLLAVYPPKGRRIEENEAEVVSALAPQLAVAVENARLHEKAKQLGSEHEEALHSERQAARHVGALYEISRSFAQSLSLDTTLDALARTMVETLAVDAAAIRMLDPRGERLETCSVHVAQEHMAEGIEAILSRPQPVAIAPVRRLMQSREPLVLHARSAADLPAHELLVPFLERGSTAVIVPVATPVEMVATVTLLSFDPAAPITDETVELALSIAGQAALAIENARLYQQQKGFADSMQRALLARTEPDLPGLDLAAVYESSARVDVGGDIYDFATLEDGRLTVVLGDVTGHGIEAAADMAMAKFVFRSLSREHPDPADFLAVANEIVLGELPVGKFITMLYLTVDPATGAVRCASAGHPGPRIVSPGRAVTELAVTGLPLGVEEQQSYEEAETVLDPGSAIVLHTDGVVEARRGRELYGVERLDRLLAERSELGAKELAAEVLAETRSFAGGDLSDDCAVVVIARPRLSRG